MNDLGKQIFETAEDSTRYTLEELAIKINECYNNIGGGLRYSAMQVVQNGAYLTVAKEKCKHGEWLHWLTNNCPEISRFTANNYINLYNKVKANVELIQHLTPTEAYKTLGIIKDNSLVSKFTGDQENYTPKEIIEDVRNVLGSINLDPASCDYAQEIVQADNFYTEEEDGLRKPWYGNVFLNPPYQMPLIRKFTDKLIEELPNIDEAILLTNNNTDTLWFHGCAYHAKVICFTKGRINFYKVDKEQTQPTNGQAFFYFGHNEQSFINNFSKYGMLMRIVNNE